MPAILKSRMIIHAEGTMALVLKNRVRIISAALLLCVKGGHSIWS